MRCKHILTHNGNAHNCGKCMPCRINYTSQWTLRLLYELKDWKDASFVTLTYNDDNLPRDMSLHLSDVQKFFDNLRHTPGIGKIKYYHCGEYGDKRKRPHYHIILFGLNPYVKEHRQAVYEAWSKCESFFFDPLPKNWRFSKSPVGKGMLPVCREDISYTCGYVQKKLSGLLAEQEYGNKKRPYCTCSKFIGFNFACEQKERLEANGFTFLNHHRIGIPRYFRDKFDLQIIPFNEKKIDWEKVDAEMQKVKEMFEKKYPYLVPKNGKNPGKEYLRLFESFYEKMEFDFCAQIERDYLQLNHIRYGIE